MDVRWNTTVFQKFFILDLRCCPLSSNLAPASIHCKTYSRCECAEGLGTSHANLCCVRQRRAGRGQTGRGSHHWCSPERCTPCLKTACGQRDRRGPVSKQIRVSVFGPFFPTQLSTCSSVRVCGSLQLFSLHLLCSAPSAPTPYTSPSPPSLSLHVHTRSDKRQHCQKIWISIWGEFSILKHTKQHTHQE